MKQKERYTVEFHLYFPTRNFLYGEWRVCACECMANLGWRLFVIKRKRNKKKKKDEKKKPMYDREKWYTTFEGMVKRAMYTRNV